jgi:mannosyltransferase OCH1-like enzyme
MLRKKYSSLCLFFLTGSLLTRCITPGDYEYLAPITPDFWQSLERDTPEFQDLYKNKIKKETKYQENLDALAVLYEKNKLTQKAITPQVKIPRKIHQILLGSPVPERYKKWQKTWMSLHPDWEYKLWTDADIPSFTMQNKDLFFSLTKSWRTRRYTSL